MKRVKIFLFIIPFLFLTTCEPQFDVTDDWKEIVVVYGLLNQSDSLQYIRVNKAFLGDGDALAMAQYYDSISYGAQLDVRIQQWKNSFMLNEFILQPDSSKPKDPGTFYYPKQVLYATNSGGSPLDEDSEYRLSIVHTKTGYTVKSKTRLVRDFPVTQPFPQAPTLAFADPNLKFKVVWQSAVNGRYYKLVIRFHYTEQDKLPPNASIQKHIDMVFPVVRSTGISGGEQLKVEFWNDQFYRTIKSQLQPNPNVWRIAGTLDIILYVAGEEFSTYLDVVAPSGGIIQEKPQYTNIENGFGIFSARYVKILPPKTLTADSEDSLCKGQFTSQLGFCNPFTLPNDPCECQ
jgi:hypothetical protein